MKRLIFASLAIPAAMIACAPTATADVYVRVPFVRVQVGGGVRVRAPFVNLYIPGGLPPVYEMPGAEPMPEFVPPQPEALSNPPKKTPAQSQPPAPKVKPIDAPPVPKVKGDDAPPTPAGVEPVLTPEQFTRNFKPKAGNYEVTLLNPITNQATTVRFSLPEGTPRRVNVSRHQIEFDYGPRQYVRIRFDRDGAEVISR